MSGKKRRDSIGQLNNHGFSLLELLVVMAIIVIVSTITAVGLNVLAEGNAKKANKTMYSKISELRTTTMSKSGEWYMVISCQDNTYKLETHHVANGEDNIKDTSKFSASRISLNYYNGDSSTGYDLRNNSLKIQFNKNDGSCKSVTINDTEEFITDNLDAPQFGKIVASVSRNNTYESKLWYKTGRVTTQN